VVKNDLPEHDTPYRIVSGRQRYQAYQSLGREYILCHMLTYDEEEFADEKKRLAQYEENLLRKHLTLLETCTLLGKAKEAYLTMYPETGKGKASKMCPSGNRA
jgi:ParB-like chromosome segregation protein Spo0J